jgi:hypothetical protein
MYRWRKITTATLLGLVIAMNSTAPATAAAKRVIEPPRRDQSFPILIQKVQKDRIKLAVPKAAEQPSPAEAGIDECVAHCSNGADW